MSSRDKHKINSKELKLKHPFSMILAGGRRSGKNQFIKKVLTSSPSIVSVPIKRLIWFYASAQDLIFDEIRKSSGGRTVEFVKGLPKDTSIEDGYIGGGYESTLIVIDDLMSEANTRPDVNHLFTRGRHLDTSVIFLVQNFHNKGKYMRENTLNADYIVLFKNPRDMTMIQYLGRQMRKEKFLQEAFEKVTKNKPYTYLFIDLRSDTLDILRFRSAIMQRYSKVLLEKV